MTSSELRWGAPIVGNTPFNLNRGRSVQIAGEPFGKFGFDVGDRGRQRVEDRFTALDVGLEPVIDRLRLLL